MQKVKAVLFGIVLLGAIVLYLTGICDLISLIITFAAIVLFDWADRTFKFKFTIFHYLIFIWAVISTTLFGRFFFLFEYYDKILHLTTPFLCSLIVFHALGKSKLSNGWKIFTTFIIVISFLHFWEIFEYLADLTMNLHLQGVYLGGKEIVSRIDDTMIDLIMGTVSSLLFMIFNLVQ